MAFKSKVVANIGTSGSPSTLTEAVAANTTATVIGLSLANTSTVNITVSARLLKADNSSAFLVKDATVLPGGAIVLVGGDQKLVLEPGDSVAAYSSAATSADAVLSYLV
jgi:hypothetical protein